MRRRLSTDGIEYVTDFRSHLAAAAAAAAAVPSGVRGAAMRRAGHRDFEDEFL
jgi:hypothetical protein